MSKIKICGIKNEDEARVVCEFEVDFIGVIFAVSKRQVSPQIAAKIAKIAHEFDKKIVGVFVDNDDDEICEICQKCELDCAQIYKIISQDLKQRLNQMGIKVWQVIRIKDEMPQIYGNFDEILFDYKGDKMGGNGQSFDPKILRGFAKNFGIAGGLNAKNVLNALSVKPDFIDINSGVEDNFGIKDPNLIKEILDLIKVKK